MGIPKWGPNLWVCCVGFWGRFWSLLSCQDEKRLFLVLEFVNGGELFSHLRKEGRLPNDDARFYAGPKSNS
eukprot:4184593-Amphidinium_carterae.2